MFDRIIQLISAATAGGAERQLADDAVMRYLRHGAADAERYLVQERSLPHAEAVKLLTNIDKENHRLNKQALLIRVFFTSVGVLGLLTLPVTFSWYTLVMCSLITLAGLRGLPMRIARLRAPRYTPAPVREVP